MARVQAAPHDADLRARVRKTGKYLTRTEVHTYAFSVAANAIFSFFPALLLMLFLIERVFRSPLMAQAFLVALRDYLPVGQELVARNLTALVWARGGVKVFSMVMLLFTSAGVFLPLEVALNEVWGIKQNRSYLGNQVISTALALGCGALAMLSVAMTAGNYYVLHLLTFQADNLVMRAIGWMIMKVFAVMASVLIFFLNPLAAAAWEGAGEAGVRLGAGDPAWCGR